MTGPDPLDELLRDLATRTQQLSAPPELDARVEAAIAAAEPLRPSGWEPWWIACRVALPFALGIAALAVALAVAEERKASRAGPSPREALAAEVEPP